MIIMIIRHDLDYSWIPSQKEKRRRPFTVSRCFCSRTSVSGSLILSVCSSSSSFLLPSSFSSCCPSSAPSSCCTLCRTSCCTPPARPSYIAPLPQPFCIVLGCSLSPASLLLWPLALPFCIVLGCSLICSIFLGKLSRRFGCPEAW